MSDIPWNTEVTSGSQCFLRTTRVVSLFYQNKLKLNAAEGLGAAVTAEQNV